MKTVLSAAAFLSFSLAIASADWVMESKIESAQMNSTITTKIKGDKVRMDIASGPMGAMSTIMDVASGDSIQLMHGQKVIMKISGDQMKQQVEMMKKMSGVTSDSAPEKPKAIGKKEKIGEWDCEIFLWKSGNTESMFWVTTSVPNLAELKAHSAKAQAAMTGGVKSGPDDADLPGVVVKTETLALGTKTTMTVTSIKEQKVDAAVFDAPKDYQAMAMPSGSPEEK